MNTTEKDFTLWNTEDLQNLMNINTGMLVMKVACSFVGIPFNMFIAIIIVHLRRLHSKPRNIFLLAMILSNLFFYVPIAFELAYWFYPSEFLCEAYVVTVGLPNILLLLYTLLALLDRFVAITRPQCHREKVTIKRAIGCLLVVSALAVIIKQLIYTVQDFLLICKPQSLCFTAVDWPMAVLCVLCISTYSIVCCNAITILRSYNRKREPKDVRQSSSRRGFDGITPNTTPVPVSTRNGHRFSDIISNDLRRGSPLVNVRAENFNSTSVSIQTTNGTISDMEIEATRSLIISVASLFMMSCIFLIYFLFFFLCQISTKPECLYVALLAPYAKEVWCFHPVLNPIICLVKNTELYFAFKGKWETQLNSVQNLE